MDTFHKQKVKILYWIIVQEKSEHISQEDSTER